MLAHKDTNNFSGVSVTGPYNYKDHKAVVWVGILSSGLVVDAEVDLSELFLWAGSLENTLELFAAKLESELKPKGLLVYGFEEIYGARAAVVRGEVLKDADVKFELYLLMGVK